MLDAGCSLIVLARPAGMNIPYHLPPSTNVPGDRAEFQKAERKGQLATLMKRLIKMDLLVIDDFKKSTKSRQNIFIISAMTDSG